MSLAAGSSRDIYNGDGVTVAFDTSFAYWADADVEVILLTSAGVETPQTLTTHYTLSGGNGNTGTVTMVTAPASGEKLVLRHNRSAKQDESFPEGAKYPNEAFERALDKIVAIQKRLEEEISRCLKLPKSDTATTLFPKVSERSGKIVVFDSDGNCVVSNDIVDSAEAARDAALIAQAAAELAQTASETAQAAAELASEQFTSVWLGNYSIENAPPATAQGQQYWNTTEQRVKISNASLVWSDLGEGVQTSQLIHNVGYLVQDTEGRPNPTRIPTWRPDISATIQAASETMLASLSTTGQNPDVRGINTIFEFLVNGLSQRWLYQAGTATAAVGSIVLPNDYHPSTNANHWKRISSEGQLYTQP